jgi:hypothetical protein
MALWTRHADGMSDDFTYKRIRLAGQQSQVVSDADRLLGYAAVCESILDRGVTLEVAMMELPIVPFGRTSDRLEYLQMAIPDPTIQLNRAYANGNTIFSDWLDSASESEIHDIIVDPLPSDNKRHTYKCRQRLAVKGIYSPRKQTALTDPLVRLHLLGGHANSRVIAQYAKAYLSKEQRRQLGPIHVGRLFCESCARTKPFAKRDPKSLSNTHKSMHGAQWVWTYLENSRTLPSLAKTDTRLFSWIEFTTTPTSIQ